MATISPHGKGWRAQIRRRGYPPISKTFPTKGKAWAWADKAEAELLAGKLNTSQHTVRDALERYRREIAPQKAGARWEDLRLGAFLRHPIANRKLGALTADNMADWRDDRLALPGKVTGTYEKPVQGSTVRRELNLWDSVLEVARKTWKWLQANPLRDVDKPPNARPRRRGIRDTEVEAMSKRLTGPKGREVFLAFRLGIETAMRAGEIMTLERAQIDLKARVAHLVKTKNGDERDVPLFPEALKIVRGLLADGRDQLFIVDNRSRDVLFRKARKAAKLSGFTFHDSRSEGISRLSKRMDVLELAAVVGHRDPKSLMHYYRATASEIARRPVSSSPRNSPKRPQQTSGGARRSRSGVSGGGTRGRR